MVWVRFWQPGDLPYLQQWAIMMTWGITPADDKAMTSFAVIAQQAVRNLFGVLSSPGGTAVVAVDGERPVGFLLLGIQPNDRTGEPQGYFADVYIEPGFRGRGIVELLHWAAEEYFRRLGLRTATNWAHAHNRQALRASARQGLVPFGVVMAKRLRAGTG